MLRLVPITFLLGVSLWLLLASQPGSASLHFTPAFTETIDDVAPDDPYVLPTADECVVGDVCKAMFNLTIPDGQIGTSLYPGRTLTVAASLQFLALLGDANVPNGAIVARVFGSERSGPLGSCVTSGTINPFDSLYFEATIDQLTTTGSPTDLSSFDAWPSQLDVIVTQVVNDYQDAELFARWIDTFDSTVLIFSLPGGGGLVVGVSGDPNQPPVAENCGPIDISFTLLGRSLDNPVVPGDEGGYPLYVCVAEGTITYELTIDPNDTPPGDSVTLFDSATCSPNTPAGSGVSVPLLGGTSSGIGGIDVTFTDVTTGGSTSATGANVGPPPPTGFQVVGLAGASFYYDINTSAVFTGPVTLCVHYDETGLAPADEAGLTLMQDSGSGFVDRTTTLDTVANIICGSAPSFSIWAVMSPSPEGTGGPPAVGGSVGLLDAEPDPVGESPRSRSDEAAIITASVGTASLITLGAGAWVWMRRRSTR